MTKWIVRIFLGLVVFVALVAWWGYSKYKKLTAGGNSATVSIQASAERVFASLANTDSLSVWMSTGGTIISERHGVFQAGDAIRVETRSRDGSKSSGLTWTITDVRSNQLVAMEMRSDTSNAVFASRRDSLVAMGDSTLIITTVSSPMLDSAATSLRDSSRKSASALLAVSSKVAVSVFRVESERELQRLKAHIEGNPMPKVEKER